MRELEPAITTTWRRLIRSVLTAVVEVLRDKVQRAPTLTDALLLKRENIQVAPGV